MEIFGVCHVHSRYSLDARLDLHALRRALIQRGDRFALMTEHADAMSSVSAEAFITECRAISDERFVFVPGFEVPYLGTHVLVIGADCYHHGATERELLTRWHQDGALLVLAHPHRNGYRTDEFLRANVCGIEIWNSQYDGIHAPRTKAWDMVRSLQSPILAFGSLDLHGPAHINGPRLAMTVSAVNMADIIARLRSGAFSIRRGAIVVLSDGTLFGGSEPVVRVAGNVMPTLIGLLRAASSLLGKIGLRSFAFKRWLRQRV